MEKKSDDELEKRIKAILGDFDPTVPPPKISPVAEGVKRPTWSVMIPTYNCAKYLTKTLESVLEQDPGPEHMQIEVVDDCSTLDDPEKVVREVGKGRVAFHRNPNNSGYCTLNFNICIQRSIGHLVHILHGDDYVLPGFYKEIERLKLDNPSAALMATRNLCVNEEGAWIFLSQVMPNHVTCSKKSQEFLFGTPIQCAGVVVKRDFYEAFGAFQPTLVHAADWEMWNRATQKVGAVVSNNVFAVYRSFEANDSGALSRCAGNLKDFLRLTEIFRQENKDFPYNEAVEHVCNQATKQAQRFLQKGNSEAAQAAEKIVECLKPPAPKGFAWFLYGLSNYLRRQADQIYSKDKFKN